MKNYYPSDEILETAIVTNIIDNQIFVKKIDQKTCTSCSIRSLCHKNDLSEIAVVSSETYQIGEIVYMVVSSQQRLLSAFYIYLCPVILLFICYFVFSQLLNLSEMKSILFSTLWIPLWIAIAMLVNRRFFEKLTINIKKKELHENSSE
jgi:positive regulator of sigma E activity